MPSLASLLDVILHIDIHLTALMAHLGAMTYVILFLILFCETGLVVFPFLPGDSLLFAAGALAARHLFHLSWLFLILIAAAVIGDTVNYWIGHAIGRTLQRHRFLIFRINPAHLKRTETFFAKYGAKAIVLARFVPIVRTVAPFVAGVGRMPYKTFLSYNIIGGTAWISLFLLLGYWFGNIPIVKAHFSLILIGIILFSFIPVIVEYTEARLDTIGNETKKSAD